MSKDRLLRSTSVIILSTSFLVLSLVPNSLFADRFNQGVFPIDSEPYGLSYEDWTIKFWQWLLSIPLDRNPISDQTGQHCGVEQGSEPVFFLAFSSGGGAERTCSIPAGKAILIPVNVVECSFAEVQVQDEAGLHKCAEEDESNNPGLYLSVDGTEYTNLEKYRVHSRAFNVMLPENSLLQVSGNTTAVSDGYWIIHEPLPPGDHIIHFKASLGDPRTGILAYSDDLSYRVKVE